MLKAYHMLGIDTADFFRLRDGRLTKEQIVQTGAQLYQRILAQGVLTSGARQVNLETTHSRQFRLDRLVQDNQYIFLSVGKRYWHEPSITNFGFIFDSDELFLTQHAILRTRDLLNDYEDVLDAVVQAMVPTRALDDEFSPDEVSRLLAALEDPNTSYVSPNDAYYTLLDAVELQQLTLPKARDATQEFLRRVRALQQQVQWTGEEARRRAYQEGETGRFEVLVPGTLALSLCRGTIREGVEYF